MNSKEFVKALKNICEEKSISEDIIFDGMTQALEKAYTKETGLPKIRIEIDRKKGEIKGYSYQKVKMYNMQPRPPLNVGCLGLFFILL